MDIVLAGILGTIIGAGLIPVIKKYYIQPIFIERKPEGKKVVVSPPLLHDEGVEKIHSFSDNSSFDWIVISKRSEGGKGIGSNNECNCDIV